MYMCIYLYIQMYAYIEYVVRHKMWHQKAFSLEPHNMKAAENTS